MKIQDLQYLATVADLQRADYEAASLHLAMADGILYAYYRGVYANGRRWLPVDQGVPEDLSVRVNGVTFKSLVTLFNPDAEARIERRNKTTIVLRTKSQSVILSTSEDLADPETTTPRTFEPLASCRTTVEQLLPEIELACGFTAKSYARPILTGLLMMFAPGRIVVMAHDGLASLFVTALAKQAVTGEQKAATPAYDLVLGLKMCQSGDVSLELTDRFLYLRGQNADFFAKLLDGTWPSYDRIMAKQEYVRSIELGADEIKSVTMAAKHLNAASDIEIVGSSGKMMLRTRESGAGQFSATLNQDADFDQVYCYDVANLQSAAQLGAKITMKIPGDDHLPTLVEATSEVGARRYWVLQRVIAGHETAKAIPTTV